MGREQNDEILNLTGETETNGSGHSIMIGDTAPAGVTTSTASSWCKVVLSGTTYYFPVWT